MYRNNLHGKYPYIDLVIGLNSGAIVFKGRLDEALTSFPDYSVFKTPPDYFVFQLTLGCENECSHCVNHMLGPIVRFDIDALVKDIKSKLEKYETRTFVNIDPNTACYDLELFLRTIIKQKVDVDLYFFGGIQPNFVTNQLVTLMKRANVKGISLPRELNSHRNF